MVKGSMFDSERRISAAWFQDSFFQMFDPRIARTGDEVMFEFLDSFFRTLGKSFDTAVFEIAHVPADLMTGS
jgi:hypothetical protein